MSPDVVLMFLPKSTPGFAILSAAFNSKVLTTCGIPNSLWNLRLIYSLLFFIEIEKKVQGLSEALGRSSVLHHWYEDYLISGDLASCRGYFTFKDESGKQISGGKYVFFLQYTRLFFS